MPPRHGTDDFIRADGSAVSQKKPMHAADQQEEGSALPARIGGWKISLCVQERLSPAPAFNYAAQDVCVAL
jgi:hypothetical protein